MGYITETTLRQWEGSQSSLSPDAYARRLHAQRGPRITTWIHPLDDGTIRCGRCKQIVTSRYVTHYPAPCGCNWLRYGAHIAAFPNRAVERQRRAMETP